MKDSRSISHIHALKFISKWQSGILNYLCLIDYLVRDRCGHQRIISLPLLGSRYQSFQFFSFSSLAAQIELARFWIQQVFASFLMISTFLNLRRVCICFRQFIREISLFSSLSSIDCAHFSCYYLILLELSHFPLYRRWRATDDVIIFEPGVSFTISASIYLHICCYLLLDFTFTDSFLNRTL